MKTSKLVGSLIFIGVCTYYSISAEYLSTDIVKGYSWRYQRIEQDECDSSSTKIIDFVIDTVWGNSADTLYFQITERDSMDANFINISHILCKKANHITHCDNMMISEIFRDYLNHKYDSLVFSSDRTFGYPTEIILDEVHFGGIKFGNYWSGVGTHFGSSVDTITFCNHIGVLGENYVHRAVYSCESYSYTITLLKYNGKDITYNSSGIKTLKNSKIFSCEWQKKYIITDNRIFLKSGFNLLGKLNPSGKSSHGVRIAPFGVGE